MSDYKSKPFSCSDFPTSDNTNFPNQIYDPKNSTVTKTGHNSPLMQYQNNEQDTALLNQPSVFNNQQQIDQLQNMKSNLPSRSHFSTGNETGVKYYMPSDTTVKDVNYNTHWNNAAGVHILRDDPFDDSNAGNRSFSLRRNVLSERKISAQMAFFCVIIGVAATAFILITFFTMTKPNNEEITNDKKNGTISKVKVNPMLLNRVDPETNRIADVQLLTENIDAQSQNLFSPSEMSASTFIVRSVVDFKEMKNVLPITITSIIIEKLVDEIDSLDSYDTRLPFELEHIADDIKHIKVSGPITEYWLQSVLNTFNKVENLTIDVDQLCIGATVRDRDSLKQIKLEYIHSLYIENSKKCTISSWIFRWELPSIKWLFISNADLTKRVYTPIHSFLKRNKDILHSVVISNSYVCSECELNNIQFTNMKEVTILGA